MTYKLSYFARRAIGEAGSSSSGYSGSWNIKEVVHTVLMFITSTAVTCLCAVYRDGINTTAVVRVAFEVAFITVFLLTYALQDMQRVFSIGGIVRNQLYVKQMAADSSAGGRTR